MKDAAALITALASLAWPALVLVLLVKFAAPLASVIQSATRRKFTVKVAGNELSMDEVSEQQIKVIADLQAKVAQIETAFTATQRAVAAATSSAGAAAESALAAADAVQAADEAASDARPESTNKRVLWVDDNPKNNSYLIALVEQRGSRVETALSTDEGLRRLARGGYDMVVSDMGRPEDEKAGIDLTRKIRSAGGDLPILIFCGSWAARNHKREALEAGANLITSSYSSLLKEMTKHGIV